jgi:DNA-directed RNA polymerase subunit RPC12/RpoP
VRKAVKCPYCDFKREFRVHKAWRFRFYDIKKLECPRCSGIFNCYQGTSPKGKKSLFIVRVRLRITKPRSK